MAFMIFVSLPDVNKNNLNFITSSSSTVAFEVSVDSGWCTMLFIKFLEYLHLMLARYCVYWFAHYLVLFFIFLFPILITD